MKEKPAAPKKTATRKKKVEDIEKIVEQKLAEREEHPPIVQPILVETAPATPATDHIEHHTPIQEIEEKAVGIWGKVRSWKWFWFAVVALALILVFIGFQWVNRGEEKRIEKRVEKKMEQVRQIEVKSDTTLLGQMTVMARRLKRQDSLIDATLHALTDLKRANEYQKSLIPRLMEEIDQETNTDREKINNPGNSDDDVRRNAREQMSRPIVKPR